MSALEEGSIRRMVSVLLVDLGLDGLELLTDFLICKGTSARKGG